MAVYPHAHLIGWLRRMSRGAVYQARYWRQEADAPLSYTTHRQCRARARQELARAGAYRHRLLVLLNEPGRYVTRERCDRIMRGEW